MSAAKNARSEGSSRDPELKRLIIRPGAIGDLIVSLPALEFCRVEYTEIWVAPQNVPLVRFADRVRSIPSTGLDLLEIGADDRVLSKLDRFDSIVCWYGTGRTQFREAVRNLPFVFHPALPSNADCHAIDFYLRQVGAREGAVPAIDVGEVERRDFVAIHPFSGSTKKNWPLECYRQLAAELSCPVEFCAGPEESLEGAVRFGNLFEVARWLASARAYVGNDSGISHLAAAVGTPVVAIFQATDPKVWAPRGNVRVVQHPTVNDVRGLLEACRHQHCA